MELLCPAGSIPALKMALNQGADAVYIGFKNETNARHFAGLNFDQKQFKTAVSLVRNSGKKLHVAINTFAHPQRWSHWTQTVDRAVNDGADVLILSDIALMQYASETYPEQELHVSVQASSTNIRSIQFYRDNYNVTRVVLPRVLSLKQVQSIAKDTDLELEVFAFGSLCIMAEGRCHLSSYMTGESPNKSGACSPAKYVEWIESNDQLETRLNGVLIDRYAKDENAAYPTLCKGRFNVDDHLYHALEEPVSLNSMEMLPELMQMGMSAIKIEGRQRSVAYVEQITRTWRQAIDACQNSLANKSAFNIDKQWQKTLSQLSEGSQTTLGAYHRKWQ